MTMLFPEQEEASTTTTYFCDAHAPVYAVRHVVDLNGNPTGGITVKMGVFQPVLRESDGYSHLRYTS